MNKNSGTITEKVIEILGIAYNEMVEKVYTTTIEDLIAQKEKAGNGFEITENFKKFVRTSIEYKFKSDIAKGISSYLISDDDIRNVKVSPTNAGFEIRLDVFEDDSKIGDIRTEFILAGGYNIQCLHYRLVTKTKLPKLNDRELKFYKECEKKLSRYEKLNTEIESLVNSNELLIERIELKQSQFDTYPPKKEFIERVFEESKGHQHNFIVLPKEWKFFNYGGCYIATRTSEGNIFDGMDDAKIEKELLKINTKRITRLYNYLPHDIKELKKYFSQNEAKIVKIQTEITEIENLMK